MKIPIPAHTHDSLSLLPFSQQVTRSRDSIHLRAAFDVTVPQAERGTHRKAWRVLRESRLQTQTETLLQQLSLGSALCSMLSIDTCLVQYHRSLVEGISIAYG